MLVPASEPRTPLPFIKEIDQDTSVPTVDDMKKRGSGGHELSWQSVLIRKRSIRLLTFDTTSSEQTTAVNPSGNLAATVSGVRQ